MCLAMPLRLISKQGIHGIAERDGAMIEVDLSLVPGSKIGDNIIVHVGVALSILENEEEQEQSAETN
jgi:hydrogenase assembly chaperone HypC/HupF